MFVNNNNKSFYKINFNSLHFVSLYQMRAARAGLPCQGAGRFANRQSLLSPLLHKTARDNLGSVRTN
eukprot:scaffold2512_cov164-Amphora_coffeaeformis.AAC.8